MEDRSMEEAPIKAGPWGGRGGSDWCLKAENVRMLIIVHGEAIDSLIINREVSSGRVRWSDKIGGEGGAKKDKFEIDWPDEFLTSIEGYYGAFYSGGPEVVRSLKFISNRTDYGPYGRQQGTHFSLPISDGMVVGFHGRAGIYLDAIGVYLRPLSMANLQISELPRWPCWGGNGGQPWDDGVFTGIRSIFLRRESTYVCSIQIEYDRNSTPVYSPLYGGGNGGAVRNTIKFDYPSEFLVYITGYYGPVQNDEGFEAIKSLTFYTNKCNYGPFGEQIGNFFSSATCKGKVVGFFGKAGANLNCLGVHIDYSIDLGELVNAHAVKQEEWRTKNQGGSGEGGR